MPNRIGNPSMSCRRYPHKDCAFGRQPSIGSSDQQVINETARCRICNNSKYLSVTIR
ncbi:MAG: hypothetical protein AB2693_16930 [Candidatus Thiodiazotropha sp.]